MSGQYPRIGREEITAAAEYNPQEAILMLMGNAALDEAEQLATGVKPHQPRFREMGWSIALETKKGVVGLWFCWLGDRFYLGYPIPTRSSPIRVSDKIIMETLGVGYALPVLQVDGTAVNDWNYAGEFKDPDKPLVKNKAGQIVAYRTRGDRLWAKFYGPRINGGSGRVWVDHTEFESNLHRFEMVDKKSRRGLAEVDYGHDHSRGIYTFPYDFSNEYAPDNPTTDKKAVFDYRDRFLKLACRIAGIMGGVKAVNIDYGFVLVPEQLTALGYRDIEWLAGEPGIRKGWNQEVVRARKNDETIVLRSGNTIVPWSTIRRVPCADMTAEKLLKLLKF